MLWNEHIRTPQNSNVNSRISSSHQALPCPQPLALLTYEDSIYLIIYICMIKGLQLWWVNPLLTTINPPKTTIYVISNHREFNLDLVVEWGNARAVTIWDVDESEVIEPLQTTGSLLAAMSDFLSWRTSTFSVIILLGKSVTNLRGVFSIVCVFIHGLRNPMHMFRSFHQNRWR